MYIIMVRYRTHHTRLIQNELVGAPEWESIESVRPQHSHTHTTLQTLYHTHSLELTYAYRPTHTHTHRLELTCRHGHTLSGWWTGRREGRFKYRTRVWSEYRVRVWRVAETWSRSGDSVSVLRRLCVRLQVVRVPPPCVADDDAQ